MDRILEHTLQQFYYRRVSQALRGRELGQVHPGAGGGEFLLKFLREPGDFFGTAVDAINGLKEFVLPDHRQTQRPAQHACEFVVSENIGGVGHADHQTIRLVFERDGAETARMHLGNQPHDLGLIVEALEINVGNIKLLREEIQHLVFGKKTILDQHAPKLAAALLLVRERGIELLLGNDFIGDQQIANADFSGPFGRGHCHGVPRWAGG